jgi:hypothetical protein
MPDFVRVRDKRTGHEYSVRRPHPQHHEVIDKPAQSRNGRALRDKPRVDLAGAPDPRPQSAGQQATRRGPAAEKKESKP